MAPARHREGADVADAGPAPLPDDPAFRQGMSWNGWRFVEPTVEAAYLRHSFAVQLGRSRLAIAITAAVALAFIVNDLVIQPADWRLWAILSTRAALVALALLLVAALRISGGRRHGLIMTVWTVALGAAVVGITMLRPPGVILHAYLALGVAICIFVCYSLPFWSQIGCAVALLGAFALWVALIDPEGHDRAVLFYTALLLWVVLGAGVGLRAERGRRLDYTMVTRLNRMNADLTRAKDAAERAYEELRSTHEQLDQANRQILDSITYARRIQTALLPDIAGIADRVGAVAVTWEPRDVVGGDYYWVGAVDGIIVMALFDCTGHGVPGAFMTMIAASALDRVLHDRAATDPAAILAAIDGLVRALLHQGGAERDSGDGLDAAICTYDPAAGRLVYAGARVPLILHGPGGMVTLPADRRSLGYRPRGRNALFTNHEIAVSAATTLYLASDGVTDQLSPQGRRFGHRQLVGLLAQLAAAPLDAQLDAVGRALVDWRGTGRSIDDVTLLACRLDVDAGRRPVGTTRAGGSLH